MFGRESGGIRVGREVRLGVLGGIVGIAIAIPLKAPASSGGGVPWDLGNVVVLEEESSVKISDERGERATKILLEALVHQFLGALSWLSLIEGRVEQPQHIHPLIRFSSRSSQRKRSSGNGPFSCAWNPVWVRRVWITEGVSELLVDVHLEGAASVVGEDRVQAGDLLVILQRSEAKTILRPQLDARDTLLWVCAVEGEAAMKDDALCMLLDKKFDVWLRTAVIDKPPMLKHVEILVGAHTMDVNGAVCTCKGISQWIELDLPIRVEEKLASRVSFPPGMGIRSQHEARGSAIFSTTVFPRATA
jgi:hypothetical protein